MPRIAGVEAIDRWRAVTLYGRNVATYKIALGKVLLDLGASEKTSVDMPELAEAFLDVYQTRLAEPRPQINIPGRRTLMETVVAGLTADTLERHQAVEIVAREGFNDVVPRFHTLPGGQLDKDFYVQEAVSAAAVGLPRGSLLRIRNYNARSHTPPVLHAYNSHVASVACSASIS